MAWYVTDGSQEFGPYSDETLRKIAASGKLKPDSAVRCDGGQWFEARYVNGLFPQQLSIMQPLQAIPIATAVPQQQSGGNVIAAIASFFIPGLGQLAQGRFLAGVFAFIAAFFMWLALLGWIVHILAALDAASYRENR